MGNNRTAAWDEFAIYAASPSSTRKMRSDFGNAYTFSRKGSNPSSKRLAEFSIIVGIDPRNDSHS
jgi:hypothetical protein